MPGVFHKIGSIITYDGQKLLVMPTEANAPVCTKCHFSNYKRHALNKPEFSCYLHGMDCSAFSRKDKRHVVFVETE